MSFEIHPETPKEGVLLAERFGSRGFQEMSGNLNRAGAPYGIEFGNLKLLSNSRMALEASEYARDNGRFDEFHEKIFRAYFTEIKDIGNPNTIIEVASNVGLDADGLKEALEEGRYLNRLDEATDDAHRQGINSTPTFIINGKRRIIGAQPIESFKRVLRDME